VRRSIDFTFFELRDARGELGNLTHESIDDLLLPEYDLVQFLDQPLEMRVTDFEVHESLFHRAWYSVPARGSRNSRAIHVHQEKNEPLSSYVMPEPRASCGSARCELKYSRFPSGENAASNLPQFCVVSLQ
jgi:hypothetical protein